MQSSLVGAERQFQAFAEWLHFGFEDLVHELSGADRMDLFSHRIQGWGFASFHLLVPAALQLSLQVAQLPSRLAQMSAEPLKLSIVQVLIESDHDGAQLTKDFLLRAIGLNLFQTSLGQGAELFAGDAQQLGSVRGARGHHELKGTVGESLKGLLS